MFVLKKNIIKKILWGVILTVIAFIIVGCGKTTGSSDTVAGIVYGNNTVPKNVKASSGTYVDRILISWDNVESAEKYYIHRTVSGSVTYVLLAETDENTFYDTSAVQGITYCYKVKAWSSVVGYSDFSEMTSGFLKTILLQTPSNVSASNGEYNSKIRLSWDIVADATSYVVYRFELDTGDYEELAIVNVNYYDDFAVSPAVTYYYKIQAANTFGASDLSAATTGYMGSVVLPAPSNLSATNGIYTDRIELSWTSVVGATGYYVYRAISYDGPYISKGLVNESSYVDSDIDSDVTYFYKVKSCDSLTYSEESEIVSGYVSLQGDSYEPDDSFETAEELSLSSITANRSYSFHVASDMDYCRFYINANKKVILYTAGNEIDTLGRLYNSDFEQIIYNDDGGDGSNFKIEYTVINSGYYYLKMGTYSNSRESKLSVMGARKIQPAAAVDTVYNYTLYYAIHDVSAVVTPVTPNISAPTNVVVSDGIYSNKIRIAWDLVGDADSYSVYRSDGSSYFEIATTNMNYYDDYSAVSGIIYSYKLVAVNGSYQSSASLSDSGYISFLPAPYNVTATKGTYSDKIEIQWAPGSNYATGYYVYRANSPNGAYDLINNINGGAILSYSDNVVTPNVAYYYKVQAYSTSPSLISGFSDIVSGSAYVEFSAPTSLEATNRDYANRIFMSWEPVAEADSYHIWRADSLHGNYSLLETVSTRYYNDYSVSQNSVYYYKVQAVKESLSLVSGFSQIVSGSTTLTLSAPTNLSATDGTYTDRVVLNWDPVDNATSYRIWRADETTNGAYDVLDSCTGTTYTDVSVSVNFSYTYMVQAMNDPLSVSSVFSSSVQGNTGSVPSVNLGDSYEPDDSFAAARTIYLSEVTANWSHTLHTNNDLDYCKFYVAEEGTKVIFYTDSPFDTLGRIYDSSYQHITYDDDSGHNLNFKIEWFAPASGYYYLKVGKYAYNQASMSDGKANEDKTKSQLPETDSNEYVLYGEINSPITVPSPSNLIASDGTYQDHIALSWDPVLDADSYVVYRSAASSSGFQEIVRVNNPFYTDTTIEADTVYYYKIKAKQGDYVSEASNMDSGYTFLPFVKVLAGEKHTLALKQNKVLYAAGISVSGALGDQPFSSPSLSVLLKEDDIDQVFSSYKQTFVLKEDGSLLGTGYNDDGQLGDGTNIDKYEFVELLSPVSGVDTGMFHSIAFEQSGRIWTTGQNANGQLADRTRTARNTWINVMIFIEERIKDVAAGTFSSFVLTDTGDLYGAGDNSFGQLGTVVSDNACFNKVLTNVKQVEGGLLCSFALKNDGTLWVAGRNENGVFGNGHGSVGGNYYSWVQVLDNVASISAGFGHVLVLKNDNTLWAAGGNNGGQLGTGGNTDQTTWVQVLSDVIDMDAGFNHSVALKSDGTVWSTGYNDMGQLGNGSFADSNSWRKAHCLWPANN